jgi:hypothetical protein
MSFTAQSLRDQLAFALDAENSDHYRDDLDYIPAINASMKWLTAVVNSAFGQNKIGEEFFREISYSGVFLTSNTSRVSLDVFPTEVWTVLAVMALPTTESNGGAPPATPDTKRSYHLSDLIHVSSQNACKRVSIEAWTDGLFNPTEAGYDGNQICDELKLYSYLQPLNYRAVSRGETSQEIEVRPAVKNGKVTVFWAKKPDEITALSDQIDFPNSVFQLLFDKALNYIAYKQGDQTTIYGVTSADIQQLITVL